MDHFLVFYKPAGFHSSAWLTYAADPRSAVRQFLECDQGSNLCPSATSTTGIQLKDGEEVCQYEHELALIEERYKRWGEWGLRRVPKEAWTNACEEIYVGEHPLQVEDYVENCISSLGFQPAPKAFLWYLRSGPLVTFYQETENDRIDVVGRYSWRPPTDGGWSEWTGSYQDLLEALVT